MTGCPDFEWLIRLYIKAADRFTFIGESLARYGPVPGAATEPGLTWAEFEAEREYSTAPARN